MALSGDFEIQIIFFVFQEGYNALHIAILHGHLPIVKYFLNSGVDANQKTKVTRTCHRSTPPADDDCVGWIVSSSAGCYQSERRYCVTAYFGRG